MLKVGIIGWRGMVGSVLMQRMQEEHDFNYIEPIFFSTSQVGLNAPNFGKDAGKLQDAYDLNILNNLDVIITCQGSEYTKNIYPKLRQNNWNGFWIDAASTLRMKDFSIISLDPINKSQIENAIYNNIKTFTGGNCTVSLMLMGLGGLFQNNLVEWTSAMTYQAASGAGAKNMRELVAQMSTIGLSAKQLLENPTSSILELDKTVNQCIRSNTFPISSFNAPLAGSLIPWIDTQLENGQSKEEWKASVEANKILGNTDNFTKIDGTCVRISSMRCHSQALTIKLKKNIPLDEIEDIISSHNQWVKLIPNEKDITIKELSPANVSGSLSIPVGRVRKMLMGDEYLNAFTVGDQLLWGAAEPLRRTLKILIENHK